MEILELIQQQSLWGSLLVTMIIIATYHFKIIIPRYRTGAQIRVDYYTKEETENLYNHLRARFKDYATDTELKSLEKLIEIRFVQQDKLLEKVIEKLDEISKKA